jgi:hypothetical protein
VKVAQKMLVREGRHFANPAIQIHIIAFCFLLYWSWPVCAFISAIRGSGQDDLRSMTWLKSHMDTVIAFYEGFYVRDGMLVDSPPGMKVCGRDKDRGWSRKRIKMMLSQLEDWYKCAVKLSKVICGNKFRASACMKIIKNSELDAFRGDKNDYGGLGLVRCLGIACRGTLIDDEIEWQYFRDMSDGLKND